MLKFARLGSRVGRINERYAGIVSLIFTVDNLAADSFGFLLMPLR